MRGRLSKYIILNLLFFSAWYSHAQLDDYTSHFEIYTVEYLDNNDQLSIDDIIRKTEKYKFSKDKSSIKKKSSTNDYWMKITLKQNVIEPKKYVLKVGYPPLKYLDFYEVEQSAVTKHFRSGSMLPVKSRVKRYRSHIFPIEIQDTEVHTYYLHLKTLGNMKVPLSIHLADDYQKESTFQTLELGIGIGLLFLVSIAAGLLFLLIRKRIYWLYALYIFFVVIFILGSSGLGFFYFWPNKPEWNLFVVRTGLYGIIIFAALFTIYFLHLEKCSKILFWLLFADAILHALFLILLFIGVEAVVLPRVTLSGFIHSIFLIVAGIVAIIKNQNQAVLYTTGVILFWVMTIVHILGLYEYLPYVPDLLLLRLAWYAEVLFLTIAVIYHFKQVLAENKLLLVKHKMTETQLIETKEALDGVQLEIEEKNRKLLASNLENAKRIKKLAAIKEATEDLKVKKKLEQLIQSQNLNNSKSAWEDFKTIFEQVNPSFFERINKEYPQLTQSDLRYAAFVKMGLSSKEIATMLNVNVESLKNTRYRIRKKINLDSSIKVNEFLLKF